MAKAKTSIRDARKGVIERRFFDKWIRTIASPHAFGDWADEGENQNLLRSRGLACERLERSGKTTPHRIDA